MDQYPFWWVGRTSVLLLCFSYTCMARTQFHSYSHPLTPVMTVRGPHILTVNVLKMKMFLIAVWSVNECWVSQWMDADVWVMYIVYFISSFFFLWVRILTVHLNFVVHVCLMTIKNTSLILNLLMTTWRLSPLRVNWLCRRIMNSITIYWKSNLNKPAQLDIQPTMD